MHIIKASKTGNTLSVAIPVSVRKEIGVDISTYFYCSAPNTNQLLYTRVQSDAVSDRVDKSQNKVKNAKRTKRSPKHKH